MSVKDNLGRPLPEATWTVANPLVAEIQLMDGETYLHALSAGETTLDPGTILWSLEGTPPADGDVLRAVPAPRGPEDPEGAELFFIERGTPTRIRATTMDGRQLWTTEINRPVKHIAADNAGGLVIVLPFLDYEGNFASIQRLDGATGRPSWEYVPIEDYSSPDDTRNHTEVAIRADNTIFVTEPHETYTDLVALDGATGALRGRTNIGTNRAHRWVDDVNDLNVTWWADATAPFVQSDGSVAVFATRWESFEYYERINCTYSGCDLKPIPGPLDSEDSEHALLYVVPEGAFTPIESELDLSNFELYEFKGQTWADTLDRLVPDGAGGLLLGVSEAGRIYRITNGLISRPLELQTAGERISGQSEYVVGDAGYVLVQKPEPESWSWVASLVSFDPQTLTVLSETPIPSFGTPHLAFALASGGVRVTDALQRQVAAATAAGWTANGLGIELSDLGLLLSGAWQQPRGNNNDQNGSRKPTVEIFVGTGILVEPPQPVTAADYKKEFGLGEKADITFRIFEQAHKDAFLQALRSSALEAVAFIGHAIRGQTETPYANEAMALSFSYTSSAVVVPVDPIFIPWDGALLGLNFDQLPAELNTPVKVVFLASCWIGDRLRAVFNPGPGRALIFATAIGEAPPGEPDIRLNRAAEAFKLLLKKLLAGQTVSQAIAEVNLSPIVTVVPPEERRFVLDWIGGADVRLK